MKCTRDRDSEMAVHATAMIANSITIALASSVLLCSYDPASGQPNPLGMRAYISIVSTAATTRFLYDAFGNAANEGATKRELDIQSPLKRARTLMRTDPAAYAALIGEKPDPNDDTYAHLDPLLKCAPALALDMRQSNAPGRIKIHYKGH